MNKLLAALLAMLFAGVAFAHDAILVPVPSGVHLGLSDRDSGYPGLHPRERLQRSGRRYSYLGRHEGNFCPPGLARKHDGCMPPGLARRYERDWRRWDRDERVARSLREPDERQARWERRHERVASR